MKLNNCLQDERSGNVLKVLNYKEVERLRSLYYL